MYNTIQYGSFIIQDLNRKEKITKIPIIGNAAMISNEFLHHI